MNEIVNRCVDVEIDGRQLKMLYTTKAAAESEQYTDILARASKDETDVHVSALLDASAGLISCLCNGWLLYQNIKNKGNGEPLITADEILLTTTPDEIKGLVGKAMEAIRLGSKTFVESSGTEKN